jgi:His/Glu/Gln/Arg/opine family amino acid ABC transporter permease subunit
MTAYSDPPKSSFQLSQLIHDTRYRSYTFQAIALVLLLLGVGYLLSNLLGNLAAAGLNISYDFLGKPAGYDINQTLIDYTNQSSHWRASIVGVLNTLLVAFLGCITATVLGVFAGVGRLSKNWLIAKLMSVYVEAFRNVPVLIWILIISTIVTILPSPRAFKGDDADTEMFLGLFAFTNRGIYAPKPVWLEGSGIVVATFILSVIAVFIYRRYATKLLYATGKMLPTGWPSLAILLVPSILMYFVMGRPIGVNYYDGQGFMVPKSLGVTSAKELDGATVCIQTGTTTELNLADFFRINNISYEPVPIETNAEAQPLYLEGACDVYTTDASGLAATRAAFENPGDHVILPEIISKEPLGPLVRHGDNDWGDITMWVLNALIAAEEYGITSANIEEMSAGTNNPEINRILGTEGELGAMIGLDNEWGKRAIAAGGNYGEIFAKNIGEETPVGLARGLNAQWKDGGLLYAPPFR